MRALDMNDKTDNSRKAAFSRIFKENEWGSEESRSGLGSIYGLTHRVRTILPRLLRAFDIGTMLDAPCGDFNWMHQIDFGSTKYIGCDIVEEIVAKNRAQHPGFEFVCLDLAEEALPAADLVFSRDCLQHLPEHDIWRVLQNLRRTGAKWLFTSSHMTGEQSISADAGGFGFLNLQLAPFNFPRPLLIMPEDHYASKAMCLWDMREMPA